MIDISISGRKRQAAERKRGKVAKLSSQRRAELIDKAAFLLRHGEPTIFRYEASLQWIVRSCLCLEGWLWENADQAAKDVVAAALTLVGAERPPWEEGQPDWADAESSFVERTRCIRCGWQLPEGHRKFCGQPCAKADKNYRHKLMQDAEHLAIRYLCGPTAVRDAA